MHKTLLLLISHTTARILHGKISRTYVNFKKLQNLQGCITVHPVIRTVEASADLQFPRKRDHK